MHLLNHAAALAHARQLAVQALFGDARIYSVQMRTGRIDRVIELHTRHVDLPAGVGKLGKITDKYSASNEWLALWLDLAILIVAPRARRRGFVFFVSLPSPSPDRPTLVLFTPIICLARCLRRIRVHRFGTTAESFVKTYDLRAMQHVTRTTNESFVKDLPEGTLATSSFRKDGAS